MPLCTLPPLDERVGLGSAIDFFADLRRDHVIPATLLVDVLLSPYAMAGSAELLMQHIARAIADLFAAHSQHDHNPSLASMAQSLGQYACFVGMSFASASVSVAREVSGYSFIRRMLKQLPQRGHGDLRDCVTQAQAAVKEAILERGGLLYFRLLYVGIIVIRKTDDLTLISRLVHTGES